MIEVTKLLQASAAGDRRAGEELLPLVYDELRRLAAHHLGEERSGHTLQPTALVHEAYLRLVGDAGWDSRGHFFAAAAVAMRRILVESARRRKSLKRGGDRSRADLELADIATPEIQEDLVALDGALSRLEEADPEAAKLVQLRYFAGMTLAEAAATMGVSPRTADRLWAYGRAWLHDAIRAAELPE
ncbi:ECF-type sigma factor [soil metagenome]